MTQHIKIGDTVEIIGLVEGQPDRRGVRLPVTVVDDPMLPGAHATLAFPDKPGWFVRYPLSMLARVSP